MTSTSDVVCFTARRTSRPEIGVIRRSAMTRSSTSSPKRSIAAWPPEASATSYPSRRSMMARLRRIPDSSSTIRILAAIARQQKLDPRLEHPGIERLLEEVDGAASQAFGASFRRAEGRQDDHAAPRAVALRQGQQIDPIQGLHSKIADDEIELFRLQPTHRLGD